MGAEKEHIYDTCLLVNKNGNDGLWVLRRQGADGADLLACVYIEYRHTLERTHKLLHLPYFDIQKS